MPSPDPKPTDDVPFERFAGPSINAPAPPITNTPNRSAIHLGLGIAAADLQQRLYFLPLPHGHGSFGPNTRTSAQNSALLSKQPPPAGQEIGTRDKSVSHSQCLKYSSSIVYTFTDYDTTPTPHFSPASAKILIKSFRNCNIDNRIPFVSHITIRVPLPLPRSS